MQYLVVAFDGTDEKALERRMAVREEHLRLAKENFDKGTILFGAGILDENGKMIGSMFVCDLPSREEVDQWLKMDPYVTGNVWQKIDVHPALVPPFCMKD